MKKYNFTFQVQYVDFMLIHNSDSGNGGQFLYARAILDCMPSKRTTPINIIESLYKFLQRCRLLLSGRIAVEKLVGIFCVTTRCLIPFINRNSIVFIKGSISGIISIYCCVFPLILRILCSWIQNYKYTRHVHFSQDTLFMEQTQRSTLVRSWIACQMNGGRP